MKNKTINYVIIALLSLLFYNCTEKKYKEKGFSVIEQQNTQETTNKLTTDTLSLETQPSKIIPTGTKGNILLPIYKVNINKKTKKRFIGTTNYHVTYHYHENDKGNQWNGNLMPGFGAIYGYNMVNVSHYNSITQTRKDFFKKPVLLKTVYYPSVSKDTLNYQPITRNYYLISAYNEDTNKDGFITTKDLRRLYYFDNNAANKKNIIPKNYSVIGSSYDAVNDFMHIYTILDENNNGKIEKTEPKHIFWINLSNPEQFAREY